MYQHALSHSRGPEPRDSSEGGEGWMKKRCRSLTRYVNSRSMLLEFPA